MVVLRLARGTLALAVRMRYIIAVLVILNNLAAKHDIYQIDTSNILFILSGAFVGLEKILKERIEKGVC